MMNYKNLLEIFPTSEEFITAVKAHRLLKDYYAANSELFEEFWKGINFKDKKIFLERGESDFLSFKFLNNIAQIIPALFQWFSQKSSVNYNSVHKYNYSSEQPESDNNLTEDATYFKYGTKNKTNLKGEYEIYSYKQDQLNNLIALVCKMSFF